MRILKFPESAAKFLNHLVFIKYENIMASVIFHFKFCISLLKHCYIQTQNYISLGRKIYEKTAKASSFLLQFSFRISV